MASVTQVKLGSTKNNGEFKIDTFNLFDEEDRQRYAELRNLAADRTKGIQIETIREYSRKTTSVEGNGETQTSTTTEEIILVVHYWEKPVAARSKGESHEESGDAKLSIVR